MNLTDYTILSFDCYGTLIDWEAGFAAVLVPWAQQVGLDVDEEALLLAYADNEAAIEREAPGMLYPLVIAKAFRRTGADLGRAVDDEWAQRMRDSVPNWPAFDDSAEALRRLRAHYDLVILSNVHRDGFAASNERLGGGEFRWIITAQDVGAYKPADPHFEEFERRLSDAGVGSREVLHVAQSLFHDHVPAKRRGLDSVWINRRHARPGWGATPQPSQGFGYRAEFDSMAAFADAVDEAFARG